MRNITRFALVALLLFMGIAISAQDAGKLKKANDLFEHFSFPAAAEAYKKILAKNDDVPEAKIKLAECYRHMLMPVEAEYWYEQVVALPESEPIHKYWYGSALKMNGKFDEAKQMFMEYAQLVPADTRGLRQVEACEQANYFLTDPGIYQISITNINSDIRDFGAAFYKDGIVFASESNVKDQEQMYNWREQPFLDLFYAECPDESVPASLEKPEQFKGKINTWVHEGTVTFTQDENTMYFTRNSYYKGNIEYDSEDKIETVNLQIYEAKAKGDDGKFADEKPLPFSNKDYSVGHPSLSHDDQALYFTSDMPGGYGGTDLYVSYKSGDSWGQPENLGPEINTEGNEMFPFISADGILYFASDALPGLGGLDIFSSQLTEDGTWTAPENLRYPINTNSDDFNFIIDETNERGYFSSNRPGGKGDDDIYSFTKLTNILIGTVVDCTTQEPIEMAKVELLEFGKLMQKRNTNRTGDFSFPISPGKDYIVRVSKADYEEGEKSVNTIGLEASQIDIIIPICPLNGPKCVVEGIVTDKDGAPIDGAVVVITNVDTREDRTFVTEADGRYSFELDSESNYTINSTKEFYFTETKSVTTVGRDCADPLQRNLPIVNFPMKPIDDTTFDPNANPNGFNPDTKTQTPGGGIIGPGSGIPGQYGENGQQIELYHIYYDFDQHYIREDAAIELDKIVKFMADNPGITVELRSHTDSRGTIPYNQALSDRRANAALQYIIARGISSSRISAKGFGESQPVNECVDGVLCSDNKHQDNRRTEFAIVGYQPNAIRILPRYYYQQDYRIGKNYYKMAPSSSSGFGASSYNSSGSTYSTGGSTYYDNSSSSSSTYNSGNTYNSGGSSSTNSLPNVYDNYNSNSSGSTNDLPNVYDNYNSSGNSSSTNSTNDDASYKGATDTEATNNSGPTIYDSPSSSQTAGTYSGGNSDSEYRIQLGAFRDPDLSQFESIMDIGRIDTENVNGIQRVLLGTFQDEAAAQEALFRIKQRGYDKAFIVNYIDGLRTGR